MWAKPTDCLVPASHFCKPRFSRSTKFLLSYTKGVGWGECNDHKLYPITSESLLLPPCGLLLLLVVWVGKPWEEKHTEKWRGGGGEFLENDRLWELCGWRKECSELVRRKY